MSRTKSASAKNYDRLCRLCKTVFGPKAKVQYVKMVEEQVFHTHKIDKFVGHSYQVVNESGLKLVEAHSTQRSVAMNKLQQRIQIIFNLITEQK